MRAAAATFTMRGRGTLQDAIDRLGFIQADPMRAPARAQDLILRHRVRGHHINDLERRYPTLRVHEDVLHEYGFASDRLHRALHPRIVNGWRAQSVGSDLELRVLEFVRNNGPTHPLELSRVMGAERSVGPWGSQSRATTLAMNTLHYRGELRIARREKGVRLYEVAPQRGRPLEPEERALEAARALVGLLSPSPKSTLKTWLRYVARRLPPTPGFDALNALLEKGEIEAFMVDGVAYLAASGWDRGAPEREVRFLAPFDPIVWDRRRFEQVHGWPYRLEAYTPVAKRKFGYYALPILWEDSVVGWVNAKVLKATDLSLDVGYARAAPTSRPFKAAFNREVERLRVFLELPT